MFKSFLATVSILTFSANTLLAQQMPTTEAEFRLYACAATVTEPSARLACYDEAVSVSFGLPVGTATTANDGNRASAWSIARETDPISGRATISASLSGNGPSGIAGFENALHLSCTAEGFDAYLTWAPNINGEDWLCLDLTRCPGTVTTRIGDASPRDETWMLYYTAPGQVMRPTGGPEQFIARLEGQESFVARIDPSSSGQSATVTYDLDGIDAVIAEVRQACR